MAAFNPCGVAMLPAFIMRLLGTRRPSPGQGLRAGVAMSSGFLLVFGVGGALAFVFRLALGAIVPWIAFVVGILFTALGILMWRGIQTLHLNVPAWTLRGSRRESFFWYGVAYAAGSLGCTLPLFSLLVLSSFAQGGWVGLAAFAWYALGMGLVVTAISVASTLSAQIATRWSAQAADWMGRLSAWITLGTGIYLIIYWWPQLSL